MLSLKDIYRHFGMRRTHEAFVRISQRESLPTAYVPIAEDLAYIGLARRRRDSHFELTDSGETALRTLDAEAGHLLPSVAVGAEPLAELV